MSVVSSGARVVIDWPLEDGSTKPCSGVVRAVTRTEKAKHGSLFKYDIQFDDGDAVSTRLVHLQWALQPEVAAEIKRKRKSDTSNKDTKEAKKGRSCGIVVPPHKRIVAPMV